MTMFDTNQLAHTDSLELSAMEYLPSDEELIEMQEMNMIAETDQCIAEYEMERLSEYDF